MDERLKISLQLVALLLVGIVLSFAPRDGRVTREYAQIQRAYEDDDYRELALGIADAAGYLTWHPELWEKAGHFARRAGEKVLAASYFERAKDLDALSGEGYLALGEIYHQLGKPESAIEMWSHIPDSPQATWHLAHMQQSRGEYEAAIQTWERYLTLVEDAGPDIHYKVGLLLTAERPAEAVDHLQQATSDYPQAEKLIESLSDIEGEEPAYRQVVAGRALGSIGRWKLAARAFEEALDLRPDYAEAWAYWGEALQQVPETQHDPLLALEHAHELDPESPLVNIFLGTFWQRRGEHSTALTYYETASELWPENPDVHVDQARSLAALGDLDAALAKFKGAIQLRPESPDYYRLLAQFCVDFHYKVEEEGLPAARKAVHLSKGTPPALLVMGQVLSRLEDLQNAKRFFVRALEVDPKNPSGHLYLGMTHLKLEEYDQAGRHLQAVLRYSSSETMKKQAQSILSTLPSE